MDTIKTPIRSATDRYFDSVFAATGGGLGNQPYGQYGKSVYDKNINPGNIKNIEEIRRNAQNEHIKQISIDTLIIASSIAFLIIMVALGIAAQKR